MIKMKRLTAIFLVLLLFCSNPVSTLAQTTVSGNNALNISAETDTSNVQTGCEECNVTDGHLESCSRYAGSEAVSCAECGQENGHTEECSANLTEENLQSVAEQLMTAETTEQMYAMVLDLMNQEPEKLMELTANEIAMLRQYIAELDPESDDTDTIDLLDTLAILPNGGEALEGDPQLLLPAGYEQLPSSGTLVAGKKYALSNNLTTDGTLTVNSGEVVIDLCGYVLAGNGKDDIISVSGAGTHLIIKDSNPTVGHGGNINSQGQWEWTSGNYNDESKGGFLYNWNSGRGITVGSSGLCTIEGGTIAGCKASVGAAVTLNSTGHLIMTGGRIMYNHTTGTTGGAIHGEPSNSNNSGSSIKLSNVNIHHNTANTNGGAILAFNAVIENCSITDNLAKGNGGGIYAKQVGSSLQNAQLRIKNCTISNNSAQSGGGIYVENALPFEITGEKTVISQNTATANGGGIYTNTNLTFTNGTVSENTAASGGGMFASAGTDLVISGPKTVITRNVAAGSGGGVYGYNISIIGDANDRIEISYNKAPDNGGGICAVGNSANDEKCVVQYCDITYNRAGIAGGGLYTSGTCPLDMDDCDVTYNDAIDFNIAKNDGMDLTGRGGGAYVQNHSTFDNVHIDNNRCMRYGGGIQVCNQNADAYFNSGTINNNLAIYSGAGAVHVTESCTFSMVNGEMVGNVCYEVGGAIHASYEANVIIQNGIIRDNKVMCGRGGAIHVDVGVNLSITGDTVISENMAYTAARPNSFEITSTEPGAEVKILGYGAEVGGYGGAIAVDSGTFNMSAGTIQNNYAQAGGGGVALVMIIMSENEPDRNKVVDFTMTGGTIQWNETDGNGGGLYLMKNNLGDIIDEALTDTTLTQDERTYLQSLKDGIPKLEISGGNIINNTADHFGGGAYQEENTQFIISGTGKVSDNTAVDGAGVYIASGTAKINGGTMSNNIASGDGGALYVNGTVEMTDGAVSANKAAADGGALYVGDGGDITMSGGSMTTNSAVNGGAVYVAGGNMMIHHGNIDSNSAYLGGAVYMAGDANTLLTMESGTMNNNTVTDNPLTTEEVEGDGGAIYATNGTIKIGLEGCSRENQNMHTALGEGRHHPEINNNTATDCGGGIAITGNGIVHFYCGYAKENQALYKGVGKNVFMVGGKFYLYDGADIGVPRDPDLVIIGGELHNECVDKIYVELLYYKDNLSENPTYFKGLAELNEYMNLPEGEYFWDAEEGYRFFGWTAKGYDSETASEHVRNKTQYKPSGTPVEIIDAQHNSLGQDQNMYDGTADNVIHLYALWAPEVSKITYVKCVDDVMQKADSHSNPATYHINETDYTLTINQISEPGYAVVGWYLYQDEGQNANWGYEPVYQDVNSKDYSNLDLDGMTQNGQYFPVNENGVLELPVESLTFGDITLIALYKPQYADLKITKTGWETIDENQTFLFKVTGKPDDPKQSFDEMVVTICGEGSTTIKHLPIGTYTVKEITDWSWRYSPDSAEIEVELDDPKVLREVSFKNTRRMLFWLSGDSYCENRWSAEGGTEIAP